MTFKFLFVHTFDRLPLQTTWFLGDAGGGNGSYAKVCHVLGLDLNFVEINQTLKLKGVMLYYEEVVIIYQEKLLVLH